MPGIRMRDATGTLRTITRIRMRDASNTLRTIQTVRMRDAAAALRTVFQNVVASVSSLFADGYGSGATFYGSVTTASVTASATGGVAPYTYLWEYVSGDMVFTITTPNAASTTFSGTGVDGTDIGANFRCKITDANGTVVYTPLVAASLYWHKV